MFKRLTTPVLLIAFNRPDLTQKVLQQIAQVRPRQLYIAIDGPRNSADLIQIKQVKKLLRTVNWDCQIHTHYSSYNLGCKYGPVSAMAWFFRHEEMGIILEDDVVACPEFFFFCETLLRKYKTKRKIGSISGNNFQFGWKNNHSSYYFSRYSHSCGWATWRRAWELYDVHIRSWPKLKQAKLLNRVFSDWSGRIYWQILFNDIYAQDYVSVWDYQWCLSMWANEMLGIIPNQNLVSNIGFGNSNATHTTRKSKFAALDINPLHFPLIHPSIIERNIEADNRTQKYHYVLWKEVIMWSLRLMHGKKEIIP